MPKERVDIHAVINAPGLECAVQGAAEQFMSPLPEGQPSDCVSVPRKALHARKPMLILRYWPELADCFSTVARDVWH